MSNAMFIDISDFQSTDIDWQSYKNWSASGDGISRISLRSSEGTGIEYVDKHYKTFRTAAESIGIDVIIHYHYAYPQFNKAPDEANWQKQVIGDIRPNDVIMLDLEEKNPSGATAQWALDWLSTAESLWGRLPVIYAYQSFIQAYLQDDRLTRYPLIYARWTYDANSRPAAPSPWKSYWALQYSDKEKVPGVNEPVDADVYTGGTTYVALNSKGEVADFVDVSQFEPAESEFECGAFSVAVCHFAGEPNHGPTGSPEDVDKYADLFLGEVNTKGVSIDDMHNLFHKASMHYWDIDSISASSLQSHDQAEIRAAIAHGYPVIVTVPESSVWDMTTKSNPYAPNWTPTGNHIFTITGIASDGNPLVHDQAAVTGGIFGKIDPQPRRYLFNSLHISWASIVQPGKTTWLPPIQSGDPLSWPPASQTLPPPKERSNWLTPGQQNQANNRWALGTKVVKQLFGVDIATNTAIYKSWVVEYQNGRNRGFPVTPEQDDVNWSNKPIKVQYFSTGSWCEFDGTTPHWYGTW
jgi:GH25 family lysozyme M1 (1,4-beta-N-acetylmuramidase)